LKEREKIIFFLNPGDFFSKKIREKNLKSFKNKNLRGNLNFKHRGQTQSMLNLIISLCLSLYVASRNRLGAVATVCRSILIRFD